MKILRINIFPRSRFTIKDLDLRHKIQIIFGLISLIPLALFAYVLLTESVSPGTYKWIVVSLSALLSLFGLELLHATMEELSDKMTLNLRLIQSERLASVGRLAGGVAHEILNPINIISGRAQLLLMEDHIDHRTQKTIRIINEQTKRVADVVNNLRHFSNRPKGGRTHLNIHELLNRILVLLEYEMRVNNIEIIKHFDATHHHVLGANDEIGQGCLNIISDAIDAMPEGGTLSVSTQGIDRNKQPFIAIRFSDTGNGIPDDVANNLFDPFFTTDEKILRSGPGLFVSFEIMKDHGGTIWIDTASTDGATFVIELPLAYTSDHKDEQNDTGKHVPEQ